MKGAFVLKKSGIMHKMHVRLPGIRKICYVDCDKLPRNVVEKAIACMPIALAMDLNRMAFFTNAICKVKETFVNNGKTEEASLSFNSDIRLNTNKNLAWVVNDNVGDWWLIGAKEPTYPCVVREMNTGQETGDAAMFTYQITWTAPVALIPCLAISI